MKTIKGKAIRIHDPRIFDIDFYGLDLIHAFGEHKEAQNEGERKYQELNPTFIHWPVTFYFSGTQYTPDFYDPESHTFFEIIGTRARYYQGQGRMLRARRQTGARIILCNPGGERFIPRFKHGGRTYLINKMKTVGRIPASEFCQDDYGKTSYSNILFLPGRLAGTT